MSRHEEAKLARYEWLCKAFHKAYFEDAIDDKTFVNANLLHSNKSYRTVQFTINIQEKCGTDVDLDAAIARFIREEVQS